MVYSLYFSIRDFFMPEYYIFFFFKKIRMLLLLLSKRNYGAINLRDFQDKFIEKRKSDLFEGSSKIEL
jgi:hypothetical protein